MYWLNHCPPDATNFFVRPICIPKSHPHAAFVQEGNDLTMYAIIVMTINQNAQCFKALLIFTFIDVIPPIFYFLISNT